MIPHFSSRSEADYAVRESRERLESLVLLEQSRRLHDRLREALEIIEPMTAQLDKVRLRPLLLRKRCDLCAV